MSKTAFLSLFDPINNEDLLFLEDPSLYFRSLKKEEICLYISNDICNTALEDRVKMLNLCGKEVKVIDDIGQLFDNVEVDNIVVPYYEGQLLGLDITKEYPKNIYYLIGYAEKKSIDTKYIDKCSERPYEGKRMHEMIVSGMRLETDIEVLTYIADNALYFVKEIKDDMHEHRFLHSVSVAKTAYQIGKQNGLDPIYCFQAGLLHDMTKDYPIEEQLELLKKEYAEYADCPDYAYHQFAGAYLAKEKYHAPMDVIESIIYHCTGKREMTSYQKCLFAADKCEPLRQFETLKLREDCINDLDKGFIGILEALKEHYIAKNIDYLDYRLNREMYEYYLNDRR